MVHMGTNDITMYICVKHMNSTCLEDPNNEPDWYEQPAYSNYMLGTDMPDTFKFPGDRDPETG